MTVQREPPPSVDAPSTLGLTLLLVAMTNYYAYDRFVLSYVLSEQCAGCDAPATSPGLAVWVIATTLASAHLLVWYRTAHQERPRVWAWLACAWLVVAAVVLATCYHQALFGKGGRWSALNAGPLLALATSLVLGSFALPQVLVARYRETRSAAAPLLVLLGTTCWAVYAAKQWSRRELTTPAAKAALLLAGSADIVSWWQTSLVMLLSFGSIAILVTWRGSPKRSSWALCAVGFASLGASVPYARDALAPLASRESAPQPLSSAASCLEGDFSSALPLESVRPGPPTESAIGYLAEPLSTSTTSLLPRLRLALDAGLHTVVVPGNRRKSRPTHTLGSLSYDEPCLAWKVMLTSHPEAPAASAFATLADIVHAGTAVRP